MNIGFILNGEDVTVDTNEENRLINILRNTFGLTGAKAGCYTGSCGSCSVIFNGDVVKSCLIPAFKLRNCEIITIEGFAQTDEYHDIIQGFSEAGLENCGYCAAGKILAAETLLSVNQQPAREEILSAFHGIKCRCSEPEGIINGVTAAAEYRMRRLYGRSA